uniref:ATP-dependent RNA helicase SUV3 homolog, mitochondrial n=1 Tax=Syphacia muris TaxID=451379 RepID=A0A0N5AMU9_9BILA
MILDQFRARPLVRELAEENGLNARLFIEAFRSFRNYCLGLIFYGTKKNDVILNVDTLFPFFLTHARKVFPHLVCIEDLRMISNLTQPHNWYSEARKLFRKVVFHAGPTNSGKTYQAVQQFLKAESGVYCAPLRLLAAEINEKSNAFGVKCDLITGEERRYAVNPSTPSSHIACTVEMLATDRSYDVAIIDEIQMLRDENRGWAWTRALLGVAAKEVHLCGEASAIDIVRSLLDETGEHVEVHKYERKTPLKISNHALGSLDKLQGGDCIICFNKGNIYGLTRRLDRLGIKFGLIYGGLPPGTKIAQAAKFNDPNDPTNVLVATDAIGMGLNLTIKRIIFSSIHKKTGLIPNYHALQIAGRAGRYGTRYEEGEVAELKKLLSKPIEPIKKVGIAPTFEQVETFAFHLPKASFSELLDIFVSVCSITDRFFMCSSVDTMKSVAKLIEHVSLPLKVRYYFCISPLDYTEQYQSIFCVKAARRLFSCGESLNFEWLSNTIGWPPKPLQRLADLLRLEQMHAVLDAYLWLSFRFPDMMPAELEAQQMKGEIDGMIQDGLGRIFELLAHDETKHTVKPADNTAQKSTADDEVAEVVKIFKNLSETLLAKGLLSEAQLQQLKAEFKLEEMKKSRLKQ